MRMAGPPGQSGRSAQSPAVQGLNRGVAHVMQPVTPAQDLLSRPASAVWPNVIAVVRIFFKKKTLISCHHFYINR